MEGIHNERRAGAPAVIGIGLVLVGIAVLALRQSGVDAIDMIEGAGWPFFVIIPGVVLLAMAMVPARPQGLGFAIAGSIVTAVGLILFYQQSTDHWESWAYLWALVPGAAGLGMSVYGLASARRDLVANGLRMAGISAVLSVAGFWFFESIFESGRVPVDLETWWPVAVIGLGLLIILGAFAGSSRSAEPSADDRAGRGGAQS